MFTCFLSKPGNDRRGEKHREKSAVTHSRLNTSSASAIQSDGMGSRKGRQRQETVPEPDYR